MKNRLAYLMQKIKLKIMKKYRGHDVRYFDFEQLKYADKSLKRLFVNQLKRCFYTQKGKYIIVRLFHENCEYIIKMPKNITTRELHDNYVGLKEYYISLSVDYHFI